MKKLIASIFVLGVLSSNTKGQVVIDSISLIADEKTNTQFCFNNTKLSAGNSIGDRYIVYYNPDTIFLNVFQSGNRAKKIAHTGSGIASATLTFYKDTTWICWKQGPFIQARFTPDAGNSWSAVQNVSPAGNVASPSIYASSNGKIHFVWSAATPTDTAVYHNVYNQGAFLAAPTVLSNPAGQGLWPSVIAIGDTVLCAWKEGPLPTKVWFRSSFNGGISWSPLSPLPTTTLLPVSKDPNLAYAYDANTGTHYVYLAYDGQNKIYLQRSTDFGNIWTAPDFISNANKLSQFAHLECNNKGFVGISYEQRPIGSSLFDDTKKDVGFTYSLSWGNSGSFSVDTLAYAHNGFGSAYPAFNKIDENNFYLAWLTRDTVSNRMNVFERRIRFNGITGMGSYGEEMNPGIRIFPNPFSTKATLRTNLVLQGATLTVFNSCGQLVKQMHDLSGQTINFLRDNLPGGLYVIRLRQNDRDILTSRLLITD